MECPATSLAGNRRERPLALAFAQVSEVWRKSENLSEESSSFPPKYFLIVISSTSLSEGSISLLGFVSGLKVTLGLLGVKENVFIEQIWRLEGSRRRGHIPLS